MEAAYILDFSLILVGITLFSVPIIIHRVVYKKSKIEECVFFSFWLTALLLNLYNVNYNTYSIYPYHQGFVWASIVLGAAKMFLLERFGKGKSIEWIKTFLSPMLLSLLIIVFALTTKSNDNYTVQFILGMAASYPIGNIIFQLILLLRKRKLIEIYGEEKFDVFRFIA